MYSAWIKVDDTLPWIEMKGVYRTKSEARKSAKRAVRSIRIKVVNLPEQRKSEKAFATIKMVR